MYCNLNSQLEVNKIDATFAFVRELGVIRLIISMDLESTVCLANENYCQ